VDIGEEEEDAEADAAVELEVGEDVEETAETVVEAETESVAGYTAAVPFGQLDWQFAWRQLTTGQSVGQSLSLFRLAYNSSVIPQYLKMLDVDSFWPLQAYPSMLQHSPLPHSVLLACFPQIGPRAAAFAVEKKKKSITRIESSHIEG
jgi:hypothetical protein